LPLRRTWTNYSSGDHYWNSWANSGVIT
jgi:hypothetical protein